MNIACFDYDGTITADRATMESIMSALAQAGWKVIVCTMRYDSPEERDSNLERLAITYPVYYSGREAKAIYLSKLGIHPTIWIDDTPAWIMCNAGDYVEARA